MIAAHAGLQQQSPSARIAADTASSAVAPALAAPQTQPSSAVESSRQDTSQAQLCICALLGRTGTATRDLPPHALQHLNMAAVAHAHMTGSLHIHIGRTAKRNRDQASFTPKYR